MSGFQSKLVYRRLFLGSIAIAGLYFLYKVRIVLVPFVFALLIAYLLNPLIVILENKKISRGWAIIITYITVFGLLSLILFKGIPVMFQELNKLVRAIPVLTEEARKFMSLLQSRFSNFELPEAFKRAFDESVHNIEHTMVEMVKTGTTKMVKLFSYLAGLLISPLFAFYMLKDLDKIKNSFELTIPRVYRNDVMALLRDFDEIISGFLRGHLLISLIVGILTGAGMYLIGTDFAIVMGIIAGIAEFIPYLGPFITAIPAIALSLLISKKTAIYALMVILVVQQLENAVLSPKILGDSLGLHPLVIIFVLLAGGELFGFAGLLLAVPVAAALKVALRYSYLKLVDEK